MGCASVPVDVYRASIGLFVPTLLGILQTRQKKAAKRWKQRKLQSAITVLATSTFLSLLVRDGVERNPGPDFEAAMDRLYKRIDSTLSQTERQITFLTREVRDLTAR